MVDGSDGRGTLDPKFGQEGTVTVAFPGADAELRSLAMFGDDSFAVVGGSQFPTASANVLLARLTAAGVLDPGFGDGGRVVTKLPYAAGASGACAVALPGDGRIVAAGAAAVGRGDDIGFSVVRYLADGALDASFGNGGIVTTAVGHAGVAGASAVTCLPDGRIIAAGGADASAGDADFAVVRYLPNGRPDLSFGDDGCRLVTMPGSHDGSASAVAVQRDGRLVLAGTAICDGQAFALVRLTPDGRLDDTFGGGGIVLECFEPYQGKGGASDVAVLSDGRILVAGLAETKSGDAAFGLMRFCQDGTLDHSFGNGGKVLTTVPATSSSAAAAIVSSGGGRFVVAGTAGWPGFFALAGYTADGALDEGFGAGGYAITPLGPNAGVSAAGVQSTGRIVVAGAVGDLKGSTCCFALAGYRDEKATW